MQKVTQTIEREDGSAVQIVATPMTGAGLAVSVDVYVLHRESPAHNWRLANNRPHPDWRKMSVTEYVQRGRPEMLQVATPGEILKVTQAALAAQPQHP